MGDRFGRAWKNILYLLGSVGGPIAFPELDTTRSVVAGKEERPTDIREETQKAVHLRRGIPDQGGAGLGAVTLPELQIMRGVVRAKKERAVDVGQPSRAGVAGAGVDVLDELCSRRRAIALPQLQAARAVAGAEKQRAADGFEVSILRRRRSGIERFQQDGALIG